jgi:hypothetical protein
MTFRHWNIAPASWFNIEGDGYACGLAICAAITFDPGRGRRRLTADVEIYDGSGHPVVFSVAFGQDYAATDGAGLGIPPRPMAAIFDSLGSSNECVVELRLQWDE